MDGLLMDTVTPGMMAPLASVTLPLMAPVVVLTVWPNVSTTEPNASMRTRGVIRQCSRLMGLLRKPRKNEGPDAAKREFSTVERTLHLSHGERNWFCQTSLSLAAPNAGFWTSVLSA